jgi:PAS domain S-box-containing protein
MHDSSFAQEPEAVSRARLSAIVESSDDVIVSKTLEGFITSWNPAAERTFGWTADEAIGRHITLIVPEDRRAEEDEVLARLRRGERIDHFETVRITKDGRRVDMSITVSPIRDADGHIVGASKVARDITDRREDEVAARRLAAIVESSDDVIVSKTLDGIITSWNPAAERIFGWTAEEAIGRHITLIIPADRRAEEDGVLARIRRGERVDHFETVRITKDGRLLDMSITVSPIRDSSGRVIGASKVARDIGERRRLEEQRAVLLRQEQEARHEAEMLNRAKDELLATVSHELRTPLNAIFGWARLIQGGALDEATRIRAINAVVRNASAQSRLIDDLIDLSRINAGRMRLDFERMDINAVVEAALETVRPAATAKSVTIVSTLDPSIEPIDGAPDRLQQVVWNLLMNSVKFTPSGGRIEVSSQRTSDSLVLVVRDTGQGIEAGMLPHVFEAFRQADSSSTRAQGGLGLGLTLVRRLVELHGGTVTAESGGKDQGATFTVSLPLPESARTVKVLAGPSTPSLQGVRVLVVDDDEEFLDLSSMTLRRAGADVRTASSAARAQELIEFWRPSVLLTDLAMPGEDGFMLVNILRTGVSKERMDLAMIAMTAYGTSETRARAVRAGFDLYLTKPIDPVGLAVAVAGVVRRPT